MKHFSQMFGGNGYNSEYLVEKRDAKIYQTPLIIIMKGHRRHAGANETVEKLKA